METGFPIEARGMSIGYTLGGGRRKVVHTSLDLKLCEGAVTCLLGLNGAGKSTLLKTICGFLPPLAGQVLVQGRPISSLTQAQLALTIGVVLTEKTNAGGISVYELVSLGRHPYTGFFGKLGPQDHKVIQESIEAVGMAHKSEAYISQLSDGERQKVMIAKTLAQQCPIIVLDEPTAFLDVTSRIETMNLLLHLAHEQGKTVLLSTHDLDLATQMGDYLWLQSRVHPMIVGTPEELIYSGELAGFFNHKGISFDISTGQIHISYKESGKKNLGE